MAIHRKRRSIDELAGPNRGRRRHVIRFTVGTRHPRIFRAAARHLMLAARVDDTGGVPPPRGEAAEVAGSAGERSHFGLVTLR